MRSTLLLIALVLSTPVEVELQGNVDDEIPWHCGDLVVVGRLETIDHEPTPKLDGDLLGHSWFNALVKVRRVLTGRTERRVVPVRYFAHTRFRQDRDFILVIDGKAPDRNLLRSAHLINGSRRQRLARSCE